MAVLVRQREWWLWGGFAGLVVAALLARWWVGGEVAPAPPMPAPPTTAAAPLFEGATAVASGFSASSAAETQVEPVADDASVEEDQPVLAEREVGAELQAIATAIQEYQRALGPLPSGANATITAALTGANSRRLALLPADHPAIQNGQLTDAWGTPYQILPNTGGGLEVRSAGADRVTGTDDDESWAVASPAQGDLAVDERLLTPPVNSEMPLPAAEEAPPPAPEP